MDYTQFIHIIVEAVKRHYPDATVRVSKILKNNGVTLDGMCIIRGNSNVSPTVYLNSFYTQFTAGRNEESILREIIQTYEIHKSRMVYCADYFRSFDRLRDKVVFKLISYEANRKLLQSVPYRKVLDLAMVYYVLFEQTREGNAYALLNSSSCKAWDIAEEDLYELAKINSEILLPARITSMYDLLRNDMGYYDMPLVDDGSELFVLTNVRGIYGAACILYEGILETFANQYHKDIILLPSSIHEVLMIPESKEISAEEYKQLVREVNQSAVEPEEKLSDSVYIYRYASNTVTIG